VLNLFAVALVYCGLGGMLAGAVSVVAPLRFLRIRTRQAGVMLFAASAVLLIAGVFAPAPRQSAAAPHADLDRAMPVWQFGEHHTAHVRATPDRVDAAIRQVTADEILLFRTLTWIRSPRLRQQDVDILHPPSAPMPVLDVARRSGFVTISDRPSREIVLVTPIARGVTATINFRIEPAGDGASDLSTETRVFAADAAAGRAFAAYWRVIYPGSALIRIMWLRAIRLRAEA
jgi:hypothetical protein